MRVATWNCEGGLDRKWTTFDSLNADLAIVQECGPGTPQLAQEHGWQALWTGINAKGIGLFARPGWTLEELPSDTPWSLTARVSGAVEFTLVGFWALTPALVRQSYTRQATMAAESLEATQGPVVFGGDFNAWADPAHLRLMNTMVSQSRPSAYHRARQCARNEEPEPTFFHQRKASLPFHVDLLFTPVEWDLSSVTVGRHEDYTATGISDHMPVVAVTAPAEGA